jgi:hypothetical protein
MHARYRFAPAAGSTAIAQKIGVQCEICQACRRPNYSLQSKIHHTPIPSKLGESVSLDVFTMPKVLSNGRDYDCFVVCVCRLSGWTVAVPGLHRGLSSKKVAQEMASRWWGPFGVPATITTDQGSHFVGNWWRTICARMGARHVFSQAYHHAANGRAEVAGRNLQDLLNSLCVEQRPKGHTWVEMLPIALRQLHDLPGPMGLSPYQIVFGGRMRSTGAIPMQYPQ